MTTWQATITLAADGAEIERVEIADPRLSVVLTNLPTTAEAFVGKTTVLMLDRIELGEPT